MNLKNLNTRKMMRSYVSFLILILGMGFENVQGQAIIVKAGLNYVNIPDVDLTKFNASARSGYFVGLGITPNAGIVRFNTEVLYSKQGWNYKNATTSGKVDLQYLLFPQSVSLNFGEVFQIHTGIQLGFITDFNIDSTTSAGDILNINNLAEQVQKLDLAVFGGAEVSPIPSFYAGVRFNHPLGNFLKKNASGNVVFAPNKDFTQNLIQIYAGIRFSLKSYLK